MGGQRLLQLRGLPGHPAVFGMHDLQTRGPAAHFAIAAQLYPPGQRVLLRGGEVKEPQGQEPRAIADPAQQLPPPAVGHLGELDFALHDGVCAGRQTAQRLDPGAVLIPRRQQEQQVLYLGNADLCEALCQCRAHAAQRRDRSLFTGLSQGRECTRFPRARLWAIARRRRPRARGRVCGSRSP